MSRRFSCGKKKEKKLEMEYIGIEFARDLTLQTERYETTQDNIFRLYLPKLTAFDIIVVNTGVHDLQVGEGGCLSLQFISASSVHAWAREEVANQTTFRSR